VKREGKGQKSASKSSISRRSATLLRIRTEGGVYQRNSYDRRGEKKGLGEKIRK